MSLFSLIRGGLGYIDFQSQPSNKELKKICNEMHSDKQWILEWCAKNMPEDLYNRMLVQYTEYYCKRNFL